MHTRGRDMSENNDYLLVKAEVLPEVFVKVMEAKRLLNSGKAVSVSTGKARTA